MPAFIMTQQLFKSQADLEAEGLDLGGAPPGR